MSTKPKTVFITGASAGIGYAVATEFAKRGGYKVYAGARNVAKMKPLKELGVITVEFDITSTESIQKVKTLIEKENDGKLDILYNNTGISSSAPVFDADLQEVRRIFDVNFFGHIEVIKAFKDLLVESKGLVVFTQSVIDLTPVPFLMAYTTSKGAFDLLAKVLALEVNNIGIKVLSIKTGAVSTEIGGDDESEISPDSVFYIEGQSKIGQLTDAKMAAPVYAKKVVNDVESSLRKETLFSTTYRGSSATAAYFMNLLLPFWAYYKIIIKVLGFEGLYKKIAIKNNKPKVD